MSSLKTKQESRAAQTAPEALRKATTPLGVPPAPPATEVKVKEKASEQRIALRIDSDEREAFKLACMRQGTTMTEALLAYIKSYTAENHS